MAVPREIRKSLSASSTREDAMLLVTLADPEWPAPKRFSSHATETLFEDESVRFVTRHADELYDHAVISMLLPDDREQELPSIPLLFENVERDMGELVDAEIDGAAVDLVVVAKSNPDLILDEVRGYVVLSAEAGDENLALEVGLEPVAAEPCPPRRMTKDNVPGIFR